MKGFFREQSGEGLTSGLYTLFLLSVILFVAVEVASYSMSVWKVYGAAGEIMEMMKSENGLDGAMKQKFNALSAVLNLGELDIHLSGTPKTVQRGDLLELEVQGRYRIRSLRPFGKELSVPVRVNLRALAHTYIRGFQF
ncbi:MAG: DUF4320 family protein [Clostridiales bacterium]|nr:DUF4320 family protein [Clostridiales bacterium]